MSLDAFGTMDAHDFMGKDGFVWWIGVVEDNKDPLKMGRARVRIFGFHNEKAEQSGIATKDLPWAIALAPLGNSSCPKSPPIATWVLGFFLDGQLAQQPVMIGAIPGYRYQDPRVDPFTASLPQYQKAIPT